jgi:oligosaccharide repeat unit polymerase
MAKLGLRAAGLAPMVASTAIILCGLASTSVATLGHDHAADVFTVASVGVGLSLSLATALEARAGFRNLIRADILILWVLYGLTLFEFLFPQSGVDNVISTDAAVNGTNAVLLGFAGLVVGRHLVQSKKTPNFAGSEPSNMFLLFVLAAMLGYLHIFLAVSFDPLEALRQMSLPRFAQSWGRGQYGDASALLYEVGALIYLIPPITGLIYARSKSYNFLQKVVVTIVFVFTIYYAFASGTRNILAIYVITFFGAYFLTKPNVTVRQVLFLAIPAVILFVIGTAYMLAFRSVGLSNFSFSEASLDTIYIDHNMVVVSQLTDLFPSSYEFLGWEIPLNALIHPIPRVLWPDKPAGLSVSLETAVHAHPGMTVSATFIGEAYMAGGLMAVLFASLIFGIAAQKWNGMARNTTAPFPLLLYVSGFFCAVISMRSMLWMFPTMLPTLALWFYGRCFGHSSRRRPAATIGPIKA